MRTRVGVVVVGCLALAGICSCNTRRLNEADAGGGGGDSGAGLPNGSGSDARVSVAPQSGFTLDWGFTTPGDGIRLVCSSGGDALAYYMLAPSGQTRRFHAGSWADPITLPVWADQVQATAMSADGAATFVWNTSSSSMPMTDDLYVDRLAPDDTWSPPSVIGNGGIAWWQDPTPPQPVLSLDAAGAGTVTWSRIDEEARVPKTWPSAVWSAHAAADGTWLNEGSIDQPNGTSSTRPSLLARAQSDTIAAWAWTDGTRAQVLVARHSGSQWSAPTVVEDAAYTDVSFSLEGGPMLAGGRTGDAILVYQRAQFGPNMTASNISVVARYSADGVSWSDAEVLAPSGATWFQLAHNGAGGAVVSWGDPGYVNNPPTPTAAMRILTPGAGWSAPVTLMAFATRSPLLVQHPDGHIAFFYAEGDGASPSALVLTTYTAAGGWQAPQIVDQNGLSVSDLCFAGDRLVAAWERSSTIGVVGVFP